MGLLATAQVRRMMKVFTSHYGSTVSSAVMRGEPVALSDYAQAFHVARSFATKDQRLTPEVERQFIDEAIRYALPFTRADYGLFVQAINLRLIAKNPKSDAHSRELRDQMAALDAAYLASLDGQQPR